MLARFTPTAETAKKTLERFHKKHRPDGQLLFFSQFWKMQNAANTSCVTLEDKINALSGKTTDNLISVDPNDELFYSPGFIRFLGNEINNKKVKYSGDYEKAKELAAAIQAGDWKHKILEIGEDIPYSIQPLIEVIKQINGKIITSQQYRNAEKTLIELPRELIFDKALDKKTVADQLALIYMSLRAEALSSNQLRYILKKHRFNRVLGSQLNTILANYQLEEGPLRSKITTIIIAYFKRHSIKNYDERGTELYKQLVFSKSLRTILNEIESAIAQLPISPHLYYAATALAAGFITDNQMDTLLLRHELAQHCGEVQIIPLLDAQGNFNEQVKPYLPEFFLKKEYTKERLEQFRLNLMATPVSEQVLFFIPDYARLRQLNGVVNTLEDIASLKGDIELNKFLAAGASDALGIAVYGKSYVKARTRLGRFTRNDIENGEKDQERYQAVWYPGAFTTVWVHDEFVPPLVGGRFHDGEIHARICSCLPYSVQKALDYMQDDLLRRVSGFYWSKEIWDFVDRAYLPKKSLQDEAIFNKCLTLSAESSSLSNAEQHYTNVTYLTLALDLHFNPSRWQRLFDLEKLRSISSPLSNLAPCLIEIQQWIKNDVMTLQVIKLGFYAYFKLNLSEKMNADQINILFDLLTQAYTDNIINIEKLGSEHFDNANMLRIRHLKSEHNDMPNSLESFIEKLKEDIDQQAETDKLESSAPRVKR